MHEIGLHHLTRGDIVRHIGSMDSYVVSGNYGDRVTAMRTVDINNPAEWVLVVKQKKHGHYVGADIAEPGNDKSVYVFNLHPPEGVEYRDHIKTFGYFLAMLQNEVWKHTALYKPTRLTISPCLWHVAEMQDGWKYEEMTGPENDRVKMVGRLEWQGLSVIVDVHQPPGGYLDIGVTLIPMSEQEKKANRIDFKVIEVGPEKKKKKKKKKYDLFCRRCSVGLMDDSPQIVRKPNGFAYHTCGCFLHTTPFPIPEKKDEEPAMCAEDENRIQCYAEGCAVRAEIEVERENATLWLCQKHYKLFIQPGKKTLSMCKDCPPGKNKICDDDEGQCLNAGEEMSPPLPGKKEFPSIEMTGVPKEVRTFVKAVFEATNRKRVYLYLEEAFKLISDMTLRISPSDERKLYQAVKDALRYTWASGWTK